MRPMGETATLIQKINPHHVVPPLEPAEQAFLNERVYTRFGVIQGTPEKKAGVLQQFTKVRPAHFLGGGGTPAMQLRVLERIYFSLHPDWKSLMTLA